MTSTSPAAPLTMDVEKAAERLGDAVTVDWLRKNIARLPHTRSGNGRGRAGRIAFTEAHLAEIVQIIEKRPQVAPAPAPKDFASVRSRGSRAGSPKTSPSAEGPLPPSAGGATSHA